MNRLLRRIAVFVGLVLLGISIYWSAVGFNFTIAGDAASDYADAAVFIAYALAISGTVMQFIFSTSLKELNATLIILGLATYVYSIFTNKAGITHFQGSEANSLAAWGLAFFLDIAPEPLIAWGLYESLVGDFLGNLGKSLMGDDTKGGSRQSKPKSTPYQPSRHNNRRGAR